MLENSKFDKILYNEMMEALKEANSGYNKIYNCETKPAELLVKRIFRYLLRLVRNKYKLSLYQTELNKFSQIPMSTPKYSEIYNSNSNYFTDSKIAVYTSIFGNYDSIYEPLIKPNNCDYYIVTDRDISHSSLWNKVNINVFEDLTSNMSNIEKNRFFKINPHLLFPEYDYSIYIDGNVQVISDLTEFINKIGKSGIAIHKHRERDCVYEEAREVLLLNRDSTDNILKHMKHIANTRMPKNYGLFECNIIARKHNNVVCKKIMNTWWEEFKEYSNRDQISFVHSLYMNKIDFVHIGILGDNVYENYALRIYRHLQ